MCGHGRGHGVHAVQDSFGPVGIGDFEPVGFIQGHDQLEGVHGIQTDAAWAEQWLGIGDVVWADLEHEVLDHQAFNFLFEYW